jgi:hypothetical protein
MTFHAGPSVTASDLHLSCFNLIVPNNNGVATMTQPTSQITPTMDIHRNEKELVVNPTPPYSLSTVRSEIRALDNGTADGVVVVTAGVGSNSPGRGDSITVWPGCASVNSIG